MTIGKKKCCLEYYFSDLTNGSFNGAWSQFFFFLLRVCFLELEKSETASGADSKVQVIPDQSKYVDSVSRAGGTIVILRNIPKVMPFSKRYT